MALSTEVVPDQAKTEAVEAHVIWMTTGLSCDGDSVAMTSAVNPSLEDIITQAIPGMPKVIVHNPVLAYENGPEFIEWWWRAERGEIDPFVLCVEGSVPNEDLSGEGYWAAIGDDPETGQPITTNEWIDRLAPKAAAVVAIGTCATYGGIPAMKNNPTGAMGVADYLGWSWKSKAGLPIVNIPGCPAQPDNMTEVLLYLALHLAGRAPVPDLDEQLRPRWLFGRTVREGCNRAGFVEQGNFATEYGDDPRCLVKLGCKGPVVKCNVPVRGWGGRVRRLPERRRHLHGVHDARLPRQVHAVHGPGPVRQRGRELRAVLDRAGHQVLPQPQHQEQVRQGAGVAQALAAPAHRLPAAQLLVGPRASEGGREMATVETPRGDQKVMVKEMSWDPITRIVGSLGIHTEIDFENREVLMLQHLDDLPGLRHLHEGDRSPRRPLHHQPHLRHLRRQPLHVLVPESEHGVWREAAAPR